jgi:uncharacterized protein (TIGR03086 family)
MLHEIMAVFGARNQERTMVERATVLVERHRRACRGFTAVVRDVPAHRWAGPTPCREWDAGALVEHVIGFHEYLLLRPLGVRAERPREGPAPRWLATRDAIERALAHPALSTPVDYFDGPARRPVDLLDAITGDVLIHTWDLARAVGVADDLDDELCSLAYDAALSAPAADGTGLFAPALPVSADATTRDRLLARRGRDPAWSPETVTEP